RWRVGRTAGVGIGGRPAHIGATAHRSSSRKSRARHRWLADGRTTTDTGPSPGWPGLPLGPRVTHLLHRHLLLREHETALTAAGELEVGTQRLVGDRHGHRGALATGLDHDRDGDLRVVPGCVAGKPGVRVARARVELIVVVSLVGLAELGCSRLAADEDLLLALGIGEWPLGPAVARMRGTLRRVDDAAH